MKELDDEADISFFLYVLPVKALILAPFGCR